MFVLCIELFVQGLGKPGLGIILRGFVNFTPEMQFENLKIVD